MAWNWEQPDWPRFRWDAARLAKAEERFLLESGVMMGTLKHVNPEDKERLMVEEMSTEALTTSEIEGEILDRASVQSSLRRQLGLATDKRRAGPAERGIAELMVDLHRGFAEPLTDETIFGWHRMVLGRRRDLRDIGRYRTSKEPMQVVSGPIQAPKVHFEAPPSAAVPREMKRFIKWFNSSAPAGGEPLPPLTRAGIAHLYFVSIHPFEDGNGRIARAISEKALAQGRGQPTLIALAAVILARRRAYYEALEAANKGTEITAWLSWFADAAVDAQRRATARVEFVIEKTRLLDRLRGELNLRQEKALLRMLREGPEGFKGGLSAGKYVTITGASPATATRDLSDMVVKRALARTGKHRHARYYLNLGRPGGD
jgi:Fic family protein